MITVDLNDLQLTELWGQDEPAMHNRSTFPLGGPLGTENSALVYIELDPGDRLGRHTDSVEEVLLILDGTVEVTVGEEAGQFSTRQIAVVPTMAPHDLRNIGEETAHVIGFFGAPSWIATFDHAFEPGGFRVVDIGEVLAQAIAAQPQTT
ncbi:MAG: cupin domain-containing protein [Chloroflexota bacterium]|nr:cupin domain-containing protein [Chloroflexota bacterium]